MLAAYRPGALVAVAVGHAAGILPRRSRGYALVGRGARALASPLAERGTAVAVVQIRGVLEQRASLWSCGETDGYDAIEARFVEAASDPAAGALVLDVDSPGGDVPGLEETVRRCRALLVGLGKPCLAYANEVIASAAYWFAAAVAVEGIFVPRAGRVGAIGTCVVHESEARRLQEEGVDVYVARSPEGKMRPNPWEPLDETGKARLDRMAANGTSRFVDAVADARRLSPAAVRAMDADLLDGDDAVRAGLADGIGTIDETIALAASLATLRRTG